MSFKGKPVSVIVTGDAKEEFERLNMAVIPKNLIPKDYVVNYGVGNLWKVNLSGAWRMIYTIRGSEVEIISLILDILDHRSYEKKFGYRKS